MWSSPSPLGVVVGKLDLCSVGLEDWVWQARGAGKGQEPTMLGQDRGWEAIPRSGGAGHETLPAHVLFQAGCHENALCCVSKGVVGCIPLPPGARRARYPV